MEIHLYNLPLDNTNNNVFCSADRHKSYFNLLEEVVDRLYDGDILSITTLDNRHIKMNDTTMSVVLPYSLETLNRYNYLWLSVPNARDKFYFIDERTSLNVGEKPSTSIKCTLDCFGTYYTEIFYGTYNKDIPCTRKSIPNFQKDINSNIIINKQFRGKCDSPNGEYEKIPCYHKGDEYREYDLLFIQLTLDPTKTYQIRRQDPSNSEGTITDEVKNFDSRYGNMTYVFIPYCYFHGYSVEPQSDLKINFGDGIKMSFFRDKYELGYLSKLIFGSDVILEAKFTCYPPFKYYYDYANDEFGIPANYCNRGILIYNDSVLVNTPVIACTSVNTLYNNYNNFIRTCNSPIYMLHGYHSYDAKNVEDIDFDYTTENNGKILNDYDLHKLNASAYNVPYNYLMVSCGSNLIPISKFYASAEFYYNILPTCDGVRIEFIVTHGSRKDTVKEMSNIVNSVFISNTNYLSIAYDNVRTFINNNLNSLTNNILFTAITTGLNARNAVNQIGVGVAQTMVGLPSGVSAIKSGKNSLIGTGIGGAKYVASIISKFQDLSNQLSQFSSTQGGGIANFAFADRVLLFYCMRTQDDSRNTKVLKDVYENGEYIDYIPFDYLSFSKSIFNAVTTDNCNIPIITNLRHRHTVENAFNNGVRYWNVDNMNVNCKYFQTNIINLDSGVI